MTKTYNGYKIGWGGKRPGAGRPKIHTDPEIRERMKKFRATDEEWTEFQNLMPNDSRQAFLCLSRLLKYMR